MIPRAVAKPLKRTTPQYVPKTSLVYFALVASPQLIRMLSFFMSLASSPQRPGTSGPQLTDNQQTPVDGVKVERSLLALLVCTTQQARFKPCKDSL